MTKSLKARTIFFREIRNEKKIKYQWRRGKKRAALKKCGDESSVARIVTQTILICIRYLEFNLRHFLRYTPCRCLTAPFPSDSPFSENQKFQFLKKKKKNFEIPQKGRVEGSQR